MSIRYARIGLKVVRIDVPREYTPTAAPLPLRTPPPAPAAPSRLSKFAAAERARGAELRRRRAALRADAANVPPVTGADLIRARKHIAKRSQRDLAKEYGCSRSIVAEAERGVRTPLPAIARWTAGTLAAQALRDAEAEAGA